MEQQSVIVTLRGVQGERVPSHMLEGISKVEGYTGSLYVADHVGQGGLRVAQQPVDDTVRRAGLNADLWKELVKQYKSSPASSTVVSGCHPRGGG